MKKILLPLLLMLPVQSLWALKTPPETMFGDGLEIPASMVAVGGGVAESTSEFGDHGQLISMAVGEAVSGTFKADLCGPTDPCILDVGYEVMEFYSDRIPVYNVELTVNGGRPITNSTDVIVGVTFRDDLSGLASADMTDVQAGTTKPLNLTDRNAVSIHLPKDGLYKYEFEFTDRAGNKTETKIQRTILRDTLPPESGTVSINHGDLFTNRSTVTLTLTSVDNVANPSGVEKVRISTSPDLLEFGKVFSFNEPETSFQWKFGDEAGGTKTIVAQFQDAAGNWSGPPYASTSIVRGFYSPGGTLAFKDESTVVRGPDGVAETQFTKVGLIIRWNPQQAGSLKSVEISVPANPAIQVQKLNIDDNSISSLDANQDIALKDEADGPKKIQAVFIDAADNHSEPVILSVRLNKDFPTPPEILAKDVFTSSITFTVQVPEFKHDVSSLSFTRRGGSDTEPVISLVSLHYATETITHSEISLIPNTRYTFEIQSKDLFRLSEKANIAPIITHAALPTVNSQLESREVSVIRVGWGANGNPPDTQYRLEYSTDVSFGNPIVDHSSWSLTLQRDVEGLATATTYYFRVRARNNQEPSVETDAVVLGSTATKSFIEPLPPINFHASPPDISSTTIIWRWLRQSSTEEGFIISNSTALTEVARIPIISYLSDTFSFSEIGLTPNTEITRSIVSYNHLTEPLKLSASTGTKVFTNPAAPLSQTLFTHGSALTANWNANGNPVGTDYNIQISTNPEFVNIQESGWIQALEKDFTDLLPATSYYVQVQARGRLNSFGLRAVSAQTFLGVVKTETYDHSNELDADNLLAFWKVMVPANALSQDYAIKMEADPTQFKSASLEMVREATEKARNESRGYRFPIPGGIVEVSLFDVIGKPLQVALAKNAVLTHNFIDLASQESAHGTFSMQSANVHPQESAPIRGAAPSLSIPDDQNKNIRLDSLRLWILNPRTSSWVKLPSNNFSTSLSEVNVTVSSFGVFAVMGAPNIDVTDVISYPVPWRPSGSNAGLGTGQTGTIDGGITFTNLPQEGKISIFDLQGSLVKEINCVGNTFEKWDVRNMAGEDVASGTYIWVTEAGSEKKTGKLMVIR